MDKTWYAFRTSPQKEFVAERILRRKGVDAFVPTEQKIRRSSRWTKKKTMVPYPMLMGYILAGFEQPVPWYELSQLNVIKTVVGFDGKPMPLPVQAINELKKKSTLYVPHRASVSSHKGFGQGDAVEAVDGPFQGYTFRVEAIRGGTAKVFAKMFGEIRELNLPVEDLEAA